MDTSRTNGVHNASADSTQISEEAIQITLPPSNDVTDKESGPIADEENKPEPEVSPKKKVIKPPMPPVKEVQWDKPSTIPEDEPDNNDVLKKVCIMSYCIIHCSNNCMSFCLDNIAYEMLNVFNVFFRF